MSMALKHCYFYVIVVESTCVFNVCMYGCWQLWVVHLFEGYSDGISVTSGLIGPTYLDFCGGGHDVGCDRGEDVDVSIHWWYWFTRCWCLVWVLGTVDEVEVSRKLASLFCP